MSCNFLSISDTDAAEVPISSAIALVETLSSVFKLITSKVSFLEKGNYLVFFSGLSSLWLVPMLFNLSYTTDMGYTPFIKLRDLIKEDIYPMIFLCLFFVIFLYKEMVSEKEIFQIALYMIFISSL
ncbi:MAG: hypothetical protein VYD33_04135, partial [Bacteroidota bacterium]|nr:hypothetical protein [Bacteroidota bacterium]